MKPFTTAGAVVFLLVAVAHLLRLVGGWPISVNGWNIPLWISAAGFLVAALLAIMLWREARR